MPFIFLKKRRYKITLSYSFLILVASLIVISHFGIPLYRLRVDRYSVISSFLSDLFSGHYPYFARSVRGNLPGPMPVYFLLALPFYLVGGLSLLSGLGYIIMAFILKRYQLNQNHNFLLFYLFTSFFMVWEIATRSNIFTNSVLLLLVVISFVRINKENDLQLIVVAILSGFMLSTRSVFILAYSIFFFSSVINEEISVKRFFVFALTSALAFIITFLPFVAVFPHDFFRMNPLIIQSSFLIPQVYTVIFILIAIIFAFFVTNDADKFFFSGLSLFISIFIYVVYYVAQYGLEVAYFHSKIDISYFIFCVPFFLIYLLWNPDVREKTIEKAN